MGRLIRNILIIGLAVIAGVSLPAETRASVAPDRTESLRKSIERKEPCTVPYLQRYYTDNRLVLVCYGPEIGWQLNPLVTLSEAGQDPNAVRATLDALLPYLEVTTTENGALNYVRANYYFDWYGIKGPWISAMTQGLLAEQAMQVYLYGGGEHYRQLWRMAVNSFFVPLEEGGISLEMPEGKWFLMLPSPEEGQILNAHLQAMDSLVRTNVLYPDAEVGQLIRFGLAALKAKLPEYDTGEWSRYGLFGRSDHASSLDYHRYQTGLLLRLFQFTREEELYRTAVSFRRYESLKLNRTPAR